MVKIEVRVPGDLIAKLRNATTGRLVQSLPRMALEFKEMILRNFDYEGRDEEGKTHTWAPLKESTVRQRARYKGPAQAAHPILELTGALKQSIRPTYSASEMYFGVTVGERYGIYHQFGTDKMPARPFLVAVRKELEEILKTYGGIE